MPEATPTRRLCLAGKGASYLIAVVVLTGVALSLAAHKPGFAIAAEPLDEAVTAEKIDASAGWITRDETLPDRPVVQPSISASGGE